MAEFHECDATDAAPTKSAPTDSAPPDSVPHDSVPPDSVPSGSVSAGSLSQVPGLLAELDAVVDRLPHDKKVAAEATLAGLACEHTPAEIGELGHRLLDNLDPDGELTDDSDRKRRRNVWVNRQDAQQMSKLTGHLDPETRALIETLWAVWATPGLNNPDDPDSPTGGVDDADPEALEAAAGRDLRSPAQRKHDALAALLRAVFDDGLLGKSHRGLPVQLIIKADLNDLIRESGVAVTATGSSLPMADVIRLAADAQQYLAVFADNSAIPLYFGQAKRLATRAQRLVSFARPDGHVCSAPDCDQPAAHAEMHHAVRDFADGGNTDIVDLAPACGPHTGWSAKTRASSPPGSTPTAPTPAACGGDATANPTLEQARARIHPPPAQAPPQRLNSFELTEMIPQPISVMEACLAHRLYTSATGRGAVTDRRAVTPSIDHARGRQSTAAGRPRRDRSRN